MDRSTLQPTDQCERADKQTSGSQGPERQETTSTAMCGNQLRQPPAHTQDRDPAPGLGMVIAIKCMSLAVRRFMKRQTIAIAQSVSSPAVTIRVIPRGLSNRTDCG